jgi:alkyldihydroxyacetonephosphate synthase
MSGRRLEHRGWGYEDQQPRPPFADALRGARLTVDPAGMMNPGVLIAPP